MKNKTPEQESIYGDLLQGLIDLLENHAHEIVKALAAEIPDDELIELLPENTLDNIAANKDWIIVKPGGDSADDILQPLAEIFDALLTEPIPYSLHLLKRNLRGHVILSYMHNGNKI